jgi:glycosyltransferase involved in cell wall biosynthesis
MARLKPARAKRPRESVVFVLPEKMGGVTNIVASLLAHRRPDGFDYHALFTHNHLHTDTRFRGTLAADSQRTIEYSLPTENLHAVMRRIAAAVPRGRGVYVAGDLLDLATASVHDFGRAVVQVLHGDSDYYYDLAVRHDPIVHAYVTYSRWIYDSLVTRLPHRKSTIFHLPYGVTIPEKRRRSVPGPLRAIFAGRIERQKGVFDLPSIDAALNARDVDVVWTIAGGGPDEAELKRQWAFNPRVRWRGVLSAPALAAVYQEQDVFVLPTWSEGFPVALLEAMAGGLVPVVSDIRSGVPEAVQSDAIGLRPPVGDVAAFANAIAALAGDRDRLETMSANARHVVVSRFDIRERVADYQRLFRRWNELYRPVAGPEHLQYGSRLDKPWIPNGVVRVLRSARRAG